MVGGWLEGGDLAETLAVVEGGGVDNGLADSVFALIECGT